MKLERYYTDNINKNHGIVCEDIYFLNEDIVKQINCGELGYLGIDCFINFDPKIGDRVELWVGEHGGWFITKFHTNLTEMII